MAEVETEDGTAQETRSYVVREPFKMVVKSEPGKLQHTTNEIVNLTEDELRSVPPEHVEPAEDSQVQMQVVQQQRLELLRAKEHAARTEQAVKEAEVGRDQAAKQAEAKVKEARFRQRLASTDLERAQARFVDKISAMGLDPDAVEAGEEGATDQPEDSEPP